MNTARVHTYKIHLDKIVRLRLLLTQEWRGFIYRLPKTLFDRPLSTLDLCRKKKKNPVHLHKKIIE